MTNIHFGIDGGQQGGLAALSTVKGITPISAIPMPMRRVEGVPQMDIRAVVQWVLDHYPTGDCHVWLEKCPKHARSQASMRSQAINYGKMIALFEARFPHMIVHRVACGNELKGWQRTMLGDFGKGETKDLARKMAQELWPKMQWPRKPKGGELDGCYDACLIAEFGRRKIEDA